MAKLKVGQVWRYKTHSPPVQDWLIVGFGRTGVPKLRNNEGEVYDFDLLQNLQDHYLLSEWDGKLRPGQRWEWRPGSCGNWVEFTIDHSCYPKLPEGQLPLDQYSETSLQNHCRTHLQQPLEFLRYLGEATENEMRGQASLRVESAPDDTSSFDDISAYREQLLKLAGLPLEFWKNDALNNTGEDNMNRLKITEVTLEDVKPSIIKARYDSLANAFGYSGEEVDGKIYFRTPGKLVGEFEVTPESLKELFRKRITEGDPNVITFAIECGVLTGGRFVSPSSSYLYTCKNCGQAFYTAGYRCGRCGRDSRLDKPADEILHLLTGVEEDCYSKAPAQVSLSVNRARERIKEILSQHILIPRAPEDLGTLEFEDDLS